MGKAFYGFDLQRIANADGESGENQEDRQDGANL